MKGVFDVNTFQRSPDTTNFESFKESIIAESDKLTESTALALRGEAYFNWLLCMISTAPADELSLWPAKIAKCGLKTEIKAKLTKCLEENQAALQEAA